MKIILKHIFRNIKEHKMRSILIFFALLISTCVLIIDIVLPDELYIKIEDTYKTIYGDSDIQISTVENFNVEDLKVNDTEFEYVGINNLNGLNKKDEPATVIGIELDKAKTIRLLGSDVDDLKDNEVAISEYTAKEKGYKVGDTIIINYEDKDYEFKVKQIISKKGLAAIEMENDIMFANIEYVSSINNSNGYSTIYLDVADADKIDDLVKYLKDNHDNYQIERTIDIDGLKEELSFVRYLMTLIFFMSTIMIVFVIGSLNKIMLAERIPVIGTFRSIGANRSKMNRILLIENALYGLFAGFFGSIAGIYLDRIVSTKFIATSGVELSKKAVSISPKLVIIGIVFAMMLQVIITAKEIIRTNKKPIKTLIFNTQSSRYKIRKARTIIGFILIALAFIVHALNKDINILFTMISLVSLTVGVANIVPLMMQKISKILALLFRKLGWSTGIIASKNMGYNKMIISSSRLIVVSLSLLSTIILVSNSFTRTFTSFREVTKGYDMIVMNVRENHEKYDKLTEIDGVKRVEYLYYYYDEKTTYNDGKKFATTPIIYTTNNKAQRYVEGINYDINKLKDGEILVDEKVAFKNNIKVGDKLNIKFENKEFDYKVVGLVDSSMFTTSRNLVVVNYDHFIKDLTDKPVQVHLVTDEGTNLEEMKKTLKDEIKEVGLRVQTVEEYIGEQEQQTGSIMSIFYVILGLSVILSFIGIVNNQIISFLQRRRELAILNSTCMSRGQLKKMLITETLLSNFVASILVLIVSYASTGFINYFMQGIEMYVSIRYDLGSILVFVGFVYVLLLFTLIIPIIKLRKMNIVNEIKYE